jgi:hypothetical protein
MPERVPQREEGRGRGEPRRNVVGAAHEDPDFTSKGLRQHDHADCGETHRCEGTTQGIEPVKRPAQVQRTLRDCVAWPELCRRVTAFLAMTGPRAGLVICRGRL